MAKRKLSFYHIWLMFLQIAHHLSTRAIISEVIYVDYTQTIHSYVYWDLSDISIGGLMVKSLYTHQHHPDLSCGQEENGLVRSQYPLPTHFLLSFTYLLEQYGEFNQCREFFILQTTDVHQNFQLDKNCLLKYTHIYTHIDRGFPGGSDGKESAAMQETWVQSLGWEDLLEKEMSTHSSILAWRIPWTEEPDRLQSMGSQRVGHD